MSSISSLTVWFLVKLPLSLLMHPAGSVSIFAAVTVLFAYPSPMLECIPKRLLFSQLPSGELEFGCVLRVPSRLDDASMVWQLRSHDGSEKVTYRRTLSSAEQDFGTVILGTVLPSSWGEGTVEVMLNGPRLVRDVTDSSSGSHSGWRWTASRWWLAVIESENPTEWREI